eukprot:GEMP01018750.1.p1 GENE.GEMP01018750.1~~GEMP01018750.1.p1  ORF type:complete len:627 (+),score=145.97 GEMP01018750.1:38-1882(+)
MKRVLLCGDVEGSFEKLFQTVNMQQEKVGVEFDALFCVGAFFPTDSQMTTEMSDYLTGKKVPSVDTYFVDTNCIPLIASGPKDFSKKLHYLGSHGIVELHGLKVAFLSGRYDKESFETSDAPFISNNYTRLATEQLKRQVDVSGACDFLLAGEWPLGWEKQVTDRENLQGDERPKIVSSVIAEVTASVEPRYLVCGSNDLFYQRPPFQTMQRGHVCRFIGLGKVGSKGKERKWLHALQITPINEMDKDSLQQRPENTTPCPFVKNVGTKRALENDEQKAQVFECEEVYLTNLPPGITDIGLRKAFLRCGDITRMRLSRDSADDSCRGYGWVTFSSIEHARKAVAMNEALESGGKKIRISFHKKKRGAGEDQVEKRRRCGPNIVVEPHADCWFCLANPKVQKHMILKVTPHVYLTTAKGGLTEDHVLILPVKHAPSYAACPVELQHSIDAFIDAVRKMFQKDGKEIIVWERWIPQRMTQANHMQIQIVAVQPNLVDAGHGIRVLEECSRRLLNGEPIHRVDGLHHIAEIVQENAQTPYCYFEMVGENTAQGRSIERYLIKGPGRPFPINFCREVAAELLDLPDRVDWRKCQMETDEETALAHKLRVKFKEFTPKL